jgi:outer membrane murein-binding lipoprotein Lpp
MKSKKVFDWLFLLSGLAILFYLFYGNPFMDPCSHVLTYKISSIDPRFNLSTEDAIRYVDASAKLWNDGLGKTVLQYDPNGKVDISFVYDERQRKTIENNILKEKTRNQKAWLDESKKDILVQKENYVQVRATLQGEVAQFNADMNSYNQKVKAINQNGGANDSQMKQLNQEKYELQARGEHLQNQIDGLNAYTKNLNSDVKAYNSEVDAVNLIVQKINNNSLGEFEEGIYTNNKIVLYEYTDIPTLERLVAHELGHALGLDHVANANSIMYYINQSKSFALTKEDITEYDQVCNKTNF